VGAVVHDATGPGATGVRVLMVDDEVDLLRVGALLLERSGFHVVTTTDPERALVILAGLDGVVPRPDVLVTDLAMPLLSGVQLVTRARALGIEIPTLVVSAFADDPDLAKVLRVGLDACLDKPLRADAFVNGVSALAARARKMRTAALAGAR
jgi:CheY-like chemotaxis protein